MDEQLDVEAIAEHIDKRRTELGISWTELSKRARVTTKTLSSYRHARTANPPESTLSRLAQALGHEDPEALIKVGRGEKVLGPRLTDKVAELREEVQDLRSQLAVLTRTVSQLIEDQARVEEQVGVLDLTHLPRTAETLFDAEFGVSSEQLRR
jgi:transcriptional regulator with XRE-family HTH domain